MLYLRRCPRDASPKAISGSASYLQACLVFRSYPHLIPTLYSGFRFGPPPRFTGASAWTQIDRLASGLPRATQALFRLGFPPAPGLLSLNLAANGNSQAHSTKGTPSPLRALTACRSTVSGSVSLPSRGSFHLSLTVLCAIGSCRVFSLGGWSPQLPTGFLVSRRTQARRQAGRPGFGYGAFTLSDGPSQTLRLPIRFVTGRSPRRRPTTPPESLPAVWAPPVSLAATQGISFDFLSCRYLDGSLPCVSPRDAMCSRRGDRLFACRVTPFGRPGIVGYLLLHPDFRSLSRPSSPGSS